MKVVFVGGHPKGRSVAFASDTFSGKRLRALVKWARIRAPEYMDLWMDQQEEDRGELDHVALVKLRWYDSNGFLIVALGNRVRRALEAQYSDFPKVVCLPHPAVRRRADFEYLKRGLKALKANPPTMRELNQEEAGVSGRTYDGPGGKKVDTHGLVKESDLA